MANRIETSLLVRGLTADTYALDVRGKTFVDGDIEVNGNVNIVGTATTINTQTVQARDNKIELNYSGSTSTAIGGGIEILSGRTDGSGVSLTIDTDRDWNSNTGFNITGRTSDSTTNGLKVVNSSGTTNLVVRNDGNIGIGTSTPTRVLDSRGTFNLQPNTNTFLRFDGTLIEAQVGSPNNQLTLNRDNSGITDLKGSGSVIISNSTYSNSLSIGSNTILRENDKIVFSRSDNFVQGWWDTINNRFRIGGGGYSPIYTSTTETFEVVGTSKITGNVGIGISGSTDVDTRLKIVGSDSSSSNYGLKVQDSGGTNNLVVRNDGNVGIGPITPSEKLEVSGKTKTTTLQVTSGATAGYVLTATDTNGNMSWQSSIKKYSTTLTSPTTGNYTITHNLDTTDISVTLWLVTTDEMTNANINTRITNSVTVSFLSDVGEDVRVVVIG